MKKNTKIEFGKACRDFIVFLFIVALIVGNGKLFAQQALSKDAKTGVGKQSETTAPTVITDRMLAGGITGITEWLMPVSSVGGLGFGKSWFIRVTDWGPDNAISLGTSAKFLARYQYLETTIYLYKYSGQNQLPNATGSQPANNGYLQKDITNGYYLDDYFVTGNTNRIYNYTSTGNYCNLFTSHINIDFSAFWWVKTGPVIWGLKAGPGISFTYLGKLDYLISPSLTNYGYGNYQTVAVQVNDPVPVLGFKSSVENSNNNSVNNLLITSPNISLGLHVRPKAARILVGINYITGNEYTRNTSLSLGYTF